MDNGQPLDAGRRDLEHPDGARMVLWNRGGRVRLAVIGSALALAAGGVAGCGSADGTPEADANQRSASNQQGRSAPPQVSGDEQSRMKKFRDCMKKNGVDVPDLSSGPPQGGP